MSGLSSWTKRGDCLSLNFSSVESARSLWHTRFAAKRPRGPVQLAMQLFDIAIGETDDIVSESKRHPSKRGAGGLKGGKAHAKKLEIAVREQSRP
jgi:hypothetical protein